MRSRRSKLATVVLLAVVVALVPVVGIAASGQPTTASNESTTSVAPGQQLHAVVEVGQAELETDVEGRAFGLAVAGAGTPAAKAAVIKQRVDSLDRRIAALENRISGLEAARDNGTLAEGAYRARATGLAARLTGAARLSNASAAASADLPVDVLAANEIDVSAIERLRKRASDLSGRAVARIARDIAGPAVGQPPGRPADVSAPPITAGGPPDAVAGGAGNGTAAGSGGDRSGR